MAIDYVSIGKRIQARRKALGKTQERLSEELSVTVGYISQIERGITKVSLDTLSRIADLLGCDIATFLSGAQESSSSYLQADINAAFGYLSPAGRKTLLGIAEVLLKNQP